MSTKKLIEQLPILYGIEKNGKIRIWKAEIYSIDTKGLAIIEYGQLDGKKQQTTREYLTGKNIGKSNETTPIMQCISETKRKWTDKIEKENYSITIPENITKNIINKSNINNQCSNNVEKVKDDKLFPMLAHKYDPIENQKKKNGIIYPCLVQPKLDGLRCIVYRGLDGKLKAQSRTGGYFTAIEHILKELESVFNLHPTLIFDGELYTTKIPFEQLAGLIKKKKITEEEIPLLRQIEYHIYDLINKNPYYVRLNEIEQILIPFKLNKIFIVQTMLANNVDDMRHFFTKFVEDGYEGIMLRNKNGLYQCNYRSNDLQKYKEFIEDEYQIVGYKQGEGKDKGTIIWICITPDGREFNVRPRGTLEYRRELFKNGDKYVGKMLTVIYQELSEMNVPRFPVGKDVREGY